MPLRAIIESILGKLAPETVLRVAALITFIALPFILIWGRGVQLEMIETRYQREAMARDVNEIKPDVDDLKHDVEALKHDVDTLKHSTELLTLDLQKAEMTLAALSAPQHSAPQTVIVQPPPPPRKKGPLRRLLFGN